MELSQLTVHEINGLIEKKEVSVKEVTQAAVDRIDAVEDKIDGYLCLTTETAMKEAEELDALIAEEGKKDVLEGIPYA